MTPSLLRVTVSRRGAASWSLHLLEEFTRQWTSVYKGHVTTRDTFDIPHLDYDNLEAGRTPVEQQTQEQRQAFDLSNRLTDELCHASHIVIATPMYNWGPPSSLKAWIDRVVNTRTFYAKSASIKDIPVTLIVSSGGPYHELPQLKQDDLLRPLLLKNLREIGANINDIMFVNIATGRLPPPPPAADAAPLLADESGPYARALKQAAAAAPRIKPCNKQEL